MACRRRHPISRASTFTENLSSSSSSSNDFNPQISRFSTFKEDSRSRFFRDDASSPPPASPSSSSSSSVAAQAIRAASAYRESDFSSTNGESASVKLNSPNSQRLNRSQQFHQSYQSPKAGSPRLQKDSNAITRSLNYIGDTFGNALEEGLTVVENRTAEIISKNRKLHARRRGSDPAALSQVTNNSSPQQPFQKRADQETQLKASCDVALAMAAKTKLLVRELNTMKADLAFAKERCAQLEEENKILRESHEKGVSLEEDDLIRLQLETLLAEKSRLANENSIYARDNRFLRGIVDYHQLTMQDVIYVNEGTEEVMEVYPIPDTMVVLDAVLSKPSVLAAPPVSANQVVLNGPPTLPTALTSTDVVSTDVVVIPSSEDQKQDNALQASSI
eukprot:TRINITY_DN17688_c0_g1_i3.p1 TRINITY_DN17688_c0_g1~~TRINITY_DN17688_c0_g1_i3.p1  ORF type:complete len:409 (+),score=84.40 TRINITY_DN17688_c0_g1_i3:57-1229(+)